MNWVAFLWVIGSVGTIISMLALLPFVFDGKGAVNTKITLFLSLICLAIAAGLTFK